jgi:hypothetical protein
MDAGATGGAVGMSREQMKKMGEADKEMELRANRAKALLAERHIGLKTNQVREWPLFAMVWAIVPCSCSKTNHIHIAHPATCVLLCN